MMCLYHTRTRATFYTLMLLELFSNFVFFNIIFPFILLSVSSSSLFLSTSLLLNIYTGNNHVEDPESISEALLARAEVLANDNDFSEASRDVTSALNIAEAAGGNGGHPGGNRGGGSNKNFEKIQELRRRQQQLQQSLKMWNERRDHNTVLELPANLDQLKQEKKCSWIKKQHNKLARKWHPDKYKGKRERGSRKMMEVSEAKKALLERHHCK